MERSLASGTYYSGRTRARPRNAPLLAYVLVAALAQASLADTLTVNGPSQNSFRSNPWSVTGSVPAFSVTFAHLDSVTYTLYAAAEVQQTFNNGSNFNEYESVNGSATVTISSSQSQVGAAFLFPSGFGVIPPHSSGTVAGFDSTNPSITGPLPTTANPGTFTLSSSGSGPSLTTLGSMQVTYSYTPIGLVQSDPILPSSTAGGHYTFTGVPSDRWFDPTMADGFRYDITSAGDQFSSIAEFPTGFSGPFFVQAAGHVFGPQHAGDALDLTALAATSFSVFGLAPDVDPTNTKAFPLRLRFNRSGVSFTMTPFVACDGDINGDRVVDDNDLSVLLNHYGLASGASLIDGDVDGDGDVDFNDLAIELSVYHQTCP